MQQDLTTDEAGGIRRMLDQLENVAEFLESGPSKRQLKFALTGKGKGYITGDEPRVLLCCELYNNRELLTRVLTYALYGEPDVSLDPIDGD